MLEQIILTFYNNELHAGKEQDCAANTTEKLRRNVEELRCTNKWYI